jgi:choline dehydrogenase-like flavoprotein
VTRAGAFIGDLVDPDTAAIRQRNESAWLLTPRGEVDRTLQDRMRHYDDSDEVDVVVVGCGAGGATMLQRLARGGWSAVGFDAGPFWDPEVDWVSDEAGSHKLYWTEPRVIGGSDPVPLGSNNSGRGVGGSMVHYAGFVPRLHPSDFRTLTNEGVGADWPIDYVDLKPYYEAIARNPSPATARCSCAERSPRESRRASALSRSRTVASVIARTASTAASASRAAKSTPRRRRSSPTYLTHWPTASRSAPTRW